VIVLGRGITALGVIRSLARSGLAAYVVGAGDDVVCRSRHYRPHPAGAGLRLCPAGLAPFLRDLQAPAVLLPCSDDWVSAIGELSPDLQERFPSSIATKAALRTLIDKGDFAGALRALDVPHPATDLVATDEDLARLDRSRLAGAFWKPRLSHAFLPHFGVKAFRIPSPEEGLSLWRQAREAGFDLVLQEYVPGPPTAHYFIDGFVDGQGVVRARFARRRLRMDPPDFGNSTYMETVPLDAVAPAAQALDRLLAGLGYRGIFSAEFKQDARDGVFRILEVNSRAWWYVGFATDCGVNVCEMAYKDALGLPIPPLRGYAVGARCAYPHHDFRSWLHSDARRRPALPALVWSWIGACQPVFRWSDPVPVIVSVWRWLKDRRRRARR
jgi:predicted ATP-grasp superfamily ATP-dependent carboligase